jgi:4-hydroxythreonine-4-phosphate dehydrogenase
VATIALTSGEPAGIGPEICTAAARKFRGARLVVIGDRGLLRGCPHVEHVPLAAPRKAGRLDTANARYVLALLDRAVAGCLSGEFDAMVTAPVHKGVINDAASRLPGTPSTSPPRRAYRTW